MADFKKRPASAEGRSLSRSEQKAKRLLVVAVETLMLDLDAEAVGRIADDVGEHGTDGDGGSLEDAVVFE